MGDGMQSLDRDGDEIDRLARLLVDAWVRSEGSAPNASYLATFVDMARAVHRDNREKHGAITWGTTCLNCASMLDQNFVDYVKAKVAEEERDKAKKELAELRDQFLQFGNHIYQQYPDIANGVWYLLGE